MSALAFAAETAADWRPSATEYHAYPAVSSSALRTFAESPNLYRMRYVERSLPPLDSRAMRVGTATHALLLEPHRFGEECAVYPGKSRREKDFMVFSAAQQARTILTEPEMRDAMAMANAVLFPLSPAAQAVQDILSLDGEAEVSHRWVHEPSGLECKVRWDWIATAGDADYVLDLKCWRHADHDGFQRDAGQRNLGIQRGFYQMGYLDRFGRPALDFIAAIQNTPAWDVGCYQATAEEIAEGMEEAEQCLYAIARAKRTGEWWAEWQNDIQTWRRPSWLRRN